MKILNASQIRAVDAYTIEHEPISSIDLMERAAIQALRALRKITPIGPYHIVCGRGNNAGDGLVMARLLHNMGEAVHVYIPSFNDGGSEDFLVNLERLQKAGLFPESVKSLPDDIQGTIVDAVFGTGVDRPLEGNYKSYVQSINAAKCPVVSIDVPSGLIIDHETCEDPEAVVAATYTLTFAQPKYAFFFPDTGRFVGKFTVIDIGWSPKGLEEQSTKMTYVTDELVADLRLNRDGFYYKNRAGHALMVGGHERMPGAITLATAACMRIGAGLVTTHTPKACIHTVAAHCPDAMLQADEHHEMVTSVQVAPSISVVGVGPGMGTDDLSANALKVLIQNGGRLVLDADALNILADNPTWLAFLPANSILTPHPGEMRRLLGDADYTVEDVIEFARRFRLVVHLKGAFSFTITSEGEVFVNSTGTPALSFGGSGDVLTGMIAGLCAQGHTSAQACVLAAFDHGLAARTLALKQTEASVTASQLLTQLGKYYSAV